MTLVQLFTLVFVIFAGSRVILRFHEKTIGYGAFLFWSGIWFVLLIIVFNPSLVDRFSTLFGPQRGIDTAFFLAIILLFYLLFRIYIKIDSLDKTLTRFNSRMSIEIEQLKNTKE